jgi:hypothetical protein
MDGDWRIALRVTAVLIWAALQYGLVYWTLRDLIGRPVVRGNNKVVWALVILTLPVVGALLYVGLGSDTVRLPIGRERSQSPAPPTPPPRDRHPDPR